MAYSLEGDQVGDFVCYHCRAGECAECVGVPCMCDCPDPRGPGEMRCAFKGCEKRGLPAPGFDFFCCRSCLKELGMLIEQKARAM